MVKFIVKIQLILIADKSFSLAAQFGGLYRRTTLRVRQEVGLKLTNIDSFTYECFNYYLYRSSAFR